MRLETENEASEAGRGPNKEHFYHIKKCEWALFFFFLILKGWGWGTGGFFYSTNLKKNIFGSKSQG